LEEDDSLYDLENIILKKQISKLDHQNGQLISKFAYLKFSMEMLHEEVAPP